MPLFVKEKDYVKCLACQHYCRLSQGAVGRCGVRREKNGQVELLVYGRPCAVNIDPIEKKPLYHFLPGTEVLSIGTYGCNFGCGFCQNWDISQLAKKDGVVAGETLSLNIFLDRLEKAAPEQLAERAATNNIPSIAYTYNEPTVWTEYAEDIGRAARKQGIKNIFVTNGYMSPENTASLVTWLDAVNIDLKAMNDDFYVKVCHGSLRPVLDNIRRFYEAGVWVEVTTLLIPGENDSDEELARLADFIASISPDIPWHLSAFHGDYKMSDRLPTAPEALVHAHGLGLAAGLKYVYIGNVEAKEYGHTFCPKCQNLLIERGYMSAEPKGLFNGVCKKCGEALPGIFV